MNAGAKKILESLGIPAAPTQQLSSCSIAVQQMVAIARAVDMECKVLILDEPTSSLDEQEVEKLFKLMLDLKSRGVGIIFVTHFLEQVHAVCDRITVLRDGKLVGEYKIADLPRVQLVSKMLGKELDDLSEIKSESAADALEGAEVVYEAAGLSSALPAYKAVVVIILVVLSAPTVREKLEALKKRYGTNEKKEAGTHAE